MSEYSNRKRDVTIYDIAEALDVAPSTVSRSLKGHPSISQKTTRRVREQAQKMGYRSNIFAQNLRRQKTNTIGVIVPRLNSNFISFAISGIENVANRKGYNIIISQSHEQASGEAASVETMLRQRADGLIVSLAYDTNDLSHFDGVIERGIPLIFFDRTPSYPSSTKVKIDNYRAAYDVVSHLVEEGCRRIVHIAGNLARNVYADRLEGYKQALQDHGIAYSEDRLIISNLEETDGSEAAQQILRMNPHPDGIFVSNDLCAASCMVHLIEHGIRVPGDIAVAGFNNDPVSRFVQPRLTTVNYNGKEIGEVVAEYLIGYLQQEGNPQDFGTITLDSKLIVRESTKKTKAN